jgi:hypothetical protein
VFLVLKHHPITQGREPLETQVNPNGSSTMCWHFVLHLNRRGVFPLPSCASSFQRLVPGG